MKSAAVLLPIENQMFPDLAKALVESFMEIGWTAMWLGDKDDIREYARSIDVAVVLTPFDYPDIHKLLPQSIKVLYQLETMPWPELVHLKRRKDWKWDKLQEYLPGYDLIWEHDIGSIRHHWCWFQQRPVFHLPIGYSPVFELDKGVKQRRTALFIGSNTRHRRQRHRDRAIRGLKSKLGKDFQIITGRYGDKARQAAKNAMVNLNIHQGKIPTFESLRMISILMSNGCFVMTEPCRYMQPFEHLEHMVIAPPHEMAGEIKYYWETPWERERIANTGYEFIKKHYTMTEHLGRVIKEI
jgi:hypothetical protein